jgi:hypothetical protein
LPRAGDHDASETIQAVYDQVGPPRKVDVAAITKGTLKEFEAMELPPPGPGTLLYTYVHLDLDPDLRNHADILRPDRPEGDNRTIAELPPEEGGLPKK